MLWAMAWRNLLRNNRRSLLTIFGIAAGLCALLFLWGFNDGSHNRMMENIQQSYLGSIQIHKQGYNAKPRLADPIVQPERFAPLFGELGIERWTTRLRTFALVAGAESSLGSMVMGIDPVHEQATSTLAAKLGEGRFIRDGDGYVCLLGATAARNLGLKVGDSLVLLTQDRFDTLAAERFTLIGILDSGEMGIDRGLAVVPLATLQTMLAMEQRVSDIVMLLPSEKLEQTTAQLKAKLAGEGVEVLRWYDIFPLMKEWVRLDNGFFYLFMSVVLVIIVAGVLNTVQASMLERVHEFGVMMGLGAKGSQIGRIVLIESLLLGLCGVLLGTLLGLALVAHFHGVGIDLSSMMDTAEKYYIDPVIRTEIDTDHLLSTILIVLLCNFLAALWPAWRATRLEPVEAIRHV